MWIPQRRRCGLRRGRHRPCMRRRERSTVQSCLAVVLCCRHARDTREEQADTRPSRRLHRDRDGPGPAGACSHVVMPVLGRRLARRHATALRARRSSRSGRPVPRVSSREGGGSAHGAKRGCAPPVGAKRGVATSTAPSGLWETRGERGAKIREDRRPDRLCLGDRRVGCVSGREQADSWRNRRRRARCGRRAAGHDPRTGRSQARSAVGRKRGGRHVL